LIPYNSWATKTFQITSTNFADPLDAANGNNVFISYIDRIADDTSESFTGIYKGTPTDLYVRVRDGGASPIKTFESPAVLGVSGGSSVASRIADA